eukprot:scaffold1091_cov164-Ochromonas_danica.AAC.51
MNELGTMPKTKRTIPWNPPSRISKTRFSLKSKGSFQIWRFGLTAGSGARGLGEETARLLCCCLCWHTRGNGLRCGRVLQKHHPHSNRGSKQLISTELKFPSMQDSIETNEDNIVKPLSAFHHFSRDFGTIAKDLLAKDGKEASIGAVASLISSKVGTHHMPGEFINEQSMSTVEEPVRYRKVEV